MKLTYDFNTMFLTVDESDTNAGKYPEAEHRVLALEIRGHLCNQANADGITNVEVHSTNMTIEIEPQMTTIERADAAVDEAIAWAVENIKVIFPLRGDKTPKATRTNYLPKAVKPTNRAKLTFSLPTDLYAYPLSNEEQNERQLGVAERLIKIDGVRNYSVYLREVTLTIDTLTTTVEEAREHVLNLLNSLTVDDDGYFPYHKALLLNVEITVEENV